MTLLIGVLCQDAVIIGADSGATFGAMGNSTIMQPMVKVHTVRDQALVATTGPVGLGQRVAHEVDRAFDSGLGNATPPVEAMVMLRKAFWTHVGLELQVASVASAAIGPMVAQTSAIQGTLVALCLDGRPRLFQFDQQAAPEEATEDLPFVCLGSGQPNADPFMAFLKELYWEVGKAPSFADGLFATVWALEQCIKVAPGGLAGPIRIFVLQSEDKCVARQMDDHEIDPHKEAVGSTKQKLKDWRNVDENAPAPPMPTGKMANQNRARKPKVDAAPVNPSVPSGPKKTP